MDGRARSPARQPGRRPSRDRVDAPAEARAPADRRSAARREWAIPRRAVRRRRRSRGNPRNARAAEPVPRRRSGSGSRSADSPPATTLLKFDPGSAMLIRAGSTIVVQMHYTTNGTPQTDRTKIGLFLAKEAPKVEMRMGTLVNGKLDIPAGEADYSIAAEMTTTADVTLRQMLPHTHLRGKSWEYTATYPDGRTRSDPGGAEVRLQLADRLRVRRNRSSCRRARRSAPSRTTTIRRRTSRTRIPK